MESILRRLIFAAKGVRTHFEAALEDEGATLPTWIALQAINRESGLSQRELAERMHLEGPTVTRHLDHLEQAGLISRHRDEVDRRILRVEMTAEGRKLHRRLRDVARINEESIIGDLPRRDAAALVRVLEHIEAKLGEADEHLAG
jgi:MarR family transcriptional regulator for hemolysin